MLTPFPSISNKAVPPKKNTQSGAGKSAELQSNSFRYGHHADSSPSSRSTATANASSASSRPAVERWLAAEKVKLWMSNMAIWIKIIGNTSSTAQGGGGSFKNRKPIGEVGCCESRMAERSHWWIERCLISLTLSLSLFLCLSTYLPIYFLCIYPAIDLSIYLSLSLSSVYLSSCLPVYLSIYRFIYLSICLSVCLSVYLSIYGAVSSSLM